jgi:hypothetical protein
MVIIAAWAKHNRRATLAIGKKSSTATDEEIAE